MSAPARTTWKHLKNSVLHSVLQCGGGFVGASRSSLVQALLAFSAAVHVASGREHNIGPGVLHRHPSAKFAQKERWKKV